MISTGWSCGMDWHLSSLPLTITPTCLCFSHRDPLTIRVTVAPDDRGQVKMSQTPEALVKMIEAEAVTYAQLLAPPNLIEVDSLTRRA